jgi:hypothetical protein
MPSGTNRGGLDFVIGKGEERGGKGIDRRGWKDKETWVVYCTIEAAH